MLESSNLKEEICVVHVVQSRKNQCQDDQRKQRIADHTQTLWIVNLQTKAQYSNIAKYLLIFTVMVN